MKPFAEPPEEERPEEAGDIPARYPAEELRPAGRSAAELCREWFHALRPGDTLMLIEPPPHYRKRLAVVQSSETIVVSVAVHYLPKEEGNSLRVFAANGYELGSGNLYPATIQPCPEDWLDKLTRRDLFAQLAALIEEEGENVLPAEALRHAIAAARRFRRQRTEEGVRQTAALRAMIARSNYPERKLP